MTYTDPSLEARRKQLLGDRYQAPTGSLIRGSVYDDPSLDTRRQQLLQRKQQQQQQKQQQPQQQEEVKTGFFQKVKSFLDQPTPDIFQSKAGELPKALTPRSDEEILNISSNDLTRRITSAQSSGRPSKGFQKALLLTEEARKPEASEFKKHSTALLMRGLRTGWQLGASLLGFGASTLDVVTQVVERSDKKQLDKFEKLYEKTGNEKYKQTADAISKISSKEIGTRKYSKSLKKWADEVNVDDPNFAEKVVEGAGSIAGFTLLSYLSGNSATIPYIAESVIEASSTYEELRDRGESIEKSSIRADQALLANLVVNKYLNIYDDLFDSVKGIKKTFKNTGLEFIQEGYQQIVFNLTTDKPWDEGVLESAAIGGVLGGATTILLPGGNKVVMNEDTKEVTVEKAEPENKILPDGEYDPQDVLDKVMSSPLQGTKEGKALIKEALDAQKTGSKVVIGEPVAKVAPEPKIKPVPQEKKVETTIKPGVATSGVEIADKKIYAELTPEQLDLLKDEVKNIEFTKEDKPHLTPMSTLENKEYGFKKVSLEELRKLSPSIDKALKKFESQSKPVEEDQKSAPDHIKKGIELSKKLSKEDVLKKATVGARAYAERNNTYEEYQSDINSLGGTFGDFEGDFNFKKDKVVVKLADGREFTFKNEDIYNQVKGTTKPKKVVKKPVSKKKVVGKLMNNIKLDIINEYLTKSYGKTIENSSKKQLIEAFARTEEYIRFNETVFKRGTSVASAIDFSDLEMRPALLYGGKAKGVFTDGFILVLDKSVANKINDKNIERATNKEIKKIQKEEDLSHAEATKKAKTNIKEAIKDNEEAYPPYKKIIPESKGKIVKKVAIKGNYTDSILVVLGGKGFQITVDADKMRFFEQNFDNIEYRSTENKQDDLKPVMVFSNGKKVGLIMPMRSDQTIDVKELETSKPSGLADAGSEYADIPKADTAKYADDDGTSRDSNYADVKSAKQTVKDIKIIEMPELVRIAKEILGNEVSLKKFRKAGQRGVFMSGGRGEINLHPAIFKDPVLTAKVMAHELGHMADWMDNRNIKRGNLVGRIASLNSFMKSTFSSQEDLVKQEELEGQREELTARRRNTDAGSTENKQLLTQIKILNKKIKVIKNRATVKDQEIRKELKDLTMLWKPFDHTANDNFTKYRYSSVELYADALSVLFNDPTLLKTKAPKFWKAFFENLDSKPKMKAELFKTWDLLTKSDEAKQDQRSKDVRDMFKKGEDKFLAMSKESKTREESYAFKFKYDHIDRNQKVIDKVNQTIKDGGTVPDDQNPVYLLEEHNYMGGVVKAWTEKNVQPIQDKLRENDLSWEDLGEVLFHERVVNERGAVENPLKHIQEVSPEMYSSIEDELPKGLIKKNATTQLAWLKKKYGELREGGTGTSYYDTLVSTLPLSIANPLGFDVKSSKEQLKHLEEQHGERWESLNNILEDFRVVMDGIAQLAEKNQFYKPELIETMKANPAYATFQVIEYLNTNISAKIGHQIGTLKEISNPAEATIMKAISTIRAIERNNVKKGITEFLSKEYSDEIEPAKTVWTGKTHIPVETKESGKKLFTVIENGSLKGYYIDEYIAKSMDRLSVGQSNAIVGVLKLVNNKLFRPLFITFNTGFQTFNLFRDFSRFYKNTPNMSILRAFQRYGQAVPSAYRRAWNKADKTITAMEESKMLGMTYNDIINGITDSDKQIDVILAKAGVTEMKKKGSRLTKPFLKVFEAIERTGNMIETIPKVAGYKQLNGKMPSKKLGSFIRTSVGSPDFLRRGAGYGWYNEVFLFSNAIKEGIRADVNVATNPETRSGFWWKTAQVSLLPKALMFAVLAGMFGDDLKEMMEGATEYDKTNYTIIPLSKDKNGKTVYLRIPQDETGRVIGGMFWKALRIINSEQPKGSDLLDIASYAGGQAPGLNPLLTSLYGMATFAAGKNPYDSFRGKNVIPDTEFEAGGKYAMKPFVIWQLNTLGLSTVWKTYYSTQPPETKTWLQKTLDAPLVSNIVGRWIKVSDYGLSEKNKAIIQGEKQEKAVGRLEEKKLVNDAIKKYKSGEEISVTKLTTEITDSLDIDRKELKTKRKAILKKLRIGIKKGESATTDSLIYATTNNEKVLILKNRKKSMSDKEIRSYMGSLIKEGIISKNVLREVLK